MRIVFTSDPELISVLIRFFTKRSWLKCSSVSHVAIRFGNEDSRWLIESDERGFNPNWWKRFSTKRRVVFEYEILQTDEKTLNEVTEEFIDEFMNVPFDRTGFVGMLIVCVWYWITGKKINNPFGLKNALTCSETVFRVMKKVEQKTGIKYFNDKNVETIFPEELLHECESKQDLFLKI